MAADLVTTPKSLTEEEQLEALLNEARLLVLNSRFEEAAEIYDDLAREMPNDARPQAGWAWALVLDAQPEQALPHAHQAMVLDPVNPEMAAVLARVYLDLGDETRARGQGMAVAAVENGPSDARAHAVLSMAYLLEGERDLALQEAELAVQLNPDDAEGHRALARVYEANGDLPAAIDQLQESARLLPKLWLAHYELGKAQLRAEEYSASIASFRRAQRLRPKASIQAGIGEAFYWLGEDNQAQAYLEQSLAAGAREAETYALLAAVNARLGHCEDARTFYQTVLAQDPDEATALAAMQQCEPLPSPVAQVDEPTPTTVETPGPALPTLTGRIAYPAWSQAQERYNVHISDLTTNQTTEVLEGMHQPEFSPDGRWLVANGEQPQQMNLILARADGSELREITKYIEDGLPAWSPDGRALAFSSNRSNDRQSRIYIIDEIWPADGQREDRVLQSELYEVLGSSPAWMADGQVIYTGCDFRASPIRCGLFALSAEVSEEEPRQLTDHPDDSAPDVHGNRLAFMSRRDGNWEIYVADTTGGGLQRLTDNQANDGLPTWSPNGEAIAFVSDRGGVWAVWVMSPDGSNGRKLFDIGGGGLLLNWQLERISWAP